ncbi:MAG: zinc ribbon domain-containing protein [Acidobacteria bacterium]|nr:zinc ribbon domain-containing protein [Acidobacteriota bacterium]
MSQDSNPLFPRRPGSEEEKDRLIRDTQNRLASEEAGLRDAGIDVCPSCGQTNRQGVKYCRGCGNPFDPNELMMITTLYGPPPMPFEDKAPPDYPPPPVYGPPPMPLRNDAPKNTKTLIWATVLGGVLFLLAAAIVILYFFFLR